jgi:hypothetical protein
MENYFKGFTVEYIERNKNYEADELAKATACNTPMLINIIFHVLEDASVKKTPLEPRVINIIEGEDWRATIMAYLCHYYEPDSKNEKIRLQQRAKDYQIVRNELYKISISAPPTPLHQQNRRPRNTPRSSCRDLQRTHRCPCISS